MNIEHIYLDMDGVLANFDKSFEDRVGASFFEYEKEHGPILAWEKVWQDKWFFTRLPDMGLELLFPALDALGLPVTILTSPSKTNNVMCVQQKLGWLEKHGLGPTPVLFERNKAIYAGPGRLLIDDFRKNVDAWTKAGGLAAQCVGCKEAARVLYGYKRGIYDRIEGRG